MSSVEAPIEEPKAPFKGKKGSKKNTNNANEKIVIAPPTKEERYLEKLVFGDEKGFSESLRNAADEYTESGKSIFAEDDEDSDAFLARLSEDEEEEEEEEKKESDEESDQDDFSKLNDDQLFMVDDSGEEDGEKMDVDGESDTDSSVSSSSDSDSDSESDAWYDSDEEKVQVSTLSSTRLKKLRRTEDEDVLRGRKYVSRLRAQFERIYPRPTWADDYGDEEEEEIKAVEKPKPKQQKNKISPKASTVQPDEVDERTTSSVVTASSNPLIDFLRSNGTYRLEDKERSLLPAEKIDMTRLTDANEKRISQSAVQAISFHKTHPLLLTGGYDRTLRVFHIDGKKNEFVTSLHFRNSPIETATFGNSESVTEIFAGGRRKYMYKWNVTAGTVEKINRMYGHAETQKSFEYFRISPDGRYIALMGGRGWTNLMSSKTGQWVRGFKIEGTLVDIEFVPAANEDAPMYLVAVNSAGEIWEFDVDSGEVQRRWRDETGVGVTTMRIAGRWMAVGSNRGIVNVYDRLKDNKLLGTVDNLVTSISCLEFNHDGQLLCIASSAKRDQLRLVHLPSCKVYQNWPTAGTPLGRVTSVCFSPGSEMLAVGNEQGRVRLWRLNHY